MMKKLFVIAVVVLFFTSCKNNNLPKPNSFLRLEYPTVGYQVVHSDCPYTFEIATNSNIYFDENCWAKIEYPQLKATVHLTYKKVSNNLNIILRDLEKLTFEHTIKADAINAQPYENFDTRVFGKLYNVEGNVATNLQFSVTDSVNHVLAGALYFYAKPNYDSILPAINYLEKDIKHLVETIEWKN